MILYVFFLYNHLLSIKAGEISSIVLIFVIMETIVIALLLLRKNPTDRTSEILPIFIAFVGTFLPLLLIPSQQVIDEQIGSIFITIGGILAIASYLSLNTSFGVTPALRSVKTTGLYQIIRHPMYLSYIIIYIGYLHLSFSLLNLTILILLLFCLFFRSFYEEKVLIQSPDYLNYTTKVKYRIIPFVY